MRILYQLMTVGLGDFYVVASSATEAEQFLLDELNMADYGFSDRRQIQGFGVIAKEIGRFSTDENLNFSSGNRLLIK